MIDFCPSVLTEDNQHHRGFDAGVSLLLAGEGDLVVGLGHVLYTQTADIHTVPLA